jgi:hypothetical protein
MPNTQANKNKAAESFDLYLQACTKDPNGFDAWGLYQQRQANRRRAARQVIRKANKSSKA